MEAQLRLARRASELWEELRSADPHRLAFQTGAVYSRMGSTPETGVFSLQVWGKDIQVSFPPFQCTDESGVALDVFTETLLAYYFHTSQTAPGYSPTPGGVWIAFTDLPDGRFYTQAFQGYTGAELARTFGNDMDAFMGAASVLGGQPVSLGDAAFSFRVLPKIYVLAAAWQGDEDFPASYRILFDGTSPHHLTTDALAIVGSNLTRRLLRQAPPGS